MNLQRNKITPWAFLRCSSLTSITIPRSVISMGGSAYDQCGNLTAIIVEPNNPSFCSLDGVLFNRDQTKIIRFPEGKSGSCTIPNGVITIMDGAFESCASLARVTIPSSVISINNGAFYGCTSLTSVTIPPNVTSVGGWVFSSCIKLADITIPNSVTNIGQEAFDFCISLTNSTIPSSVIRIGDLAFDECATLAAITVDALNPAYSSTDGVLYDKRQRMLFQCPAGKVRSVIIPNSVTNIGQEAFSHCSQLTGVYFLGNAPSVDSSAFSYSYGVTVYYLPWATGWTTSFCGRPTALWIPQVPGGNNFGIRTNQFGFDIAWASGRVVVVDACTNLTNPVWTPVGTYTLTGSAACFSDPQWINYPRRFYRIRSP